jgi:mono/diheme cytochrome c family protein
MKPMARYVLATGLLALVSLIRPGAVEAQRSGVEIWSQTCGRCHMIQPANRYTSDQWESIMANMMILARMTDDEAAAVLEFLQGGAKEAASADSPAAPRSAGVAVASIGGVPAEALRVQQDGAEAVYRRLCLACHGREGKGDGSAAAALDPAPTDFSAAEFQEGRSDEEIAQAVTDGTGSMPGFGSQLSDEEIEALVEYVRHFGGDASS